MSTQNTHESTPDRRAQQQLGSFHVSHVMFTWSTVESPEIGLVNIIKWIINGDGAKYDIHVQNGKYPDYCGRFPLENSVKCKSGPDLEKFGQVNSRLERIDSINIFNLTWY